MFYCPSVLAQPRTIYELQYTTAADGGSPWAGQVVDCSGGVVTQKFPGYRPKFTIQDPNNPDAWGAIQVKDWMYPFDMYNAVAVGDWVTVQNVLVEEFVGNTTLQYQTAYNPSYTIVSHNNPLPESLYIDPNDIASPVEGPVGEWYVTDHSAERYEHMKLIIDRVMVAEMDLGKARDNYVLQATDDPNIGCWAADYLNIDIPPTSDYHDYVTMGQAFCRVEGILEQYTRPDNGWDYYQLLSISTESFTIEQTADLDDDCDVDLGDLEAFCGYWLAQDCTDPNWCGGSDLTRDESPGMVNGDDFAIVAKYWLKGKR